MAFGDDELWQTYWNATTDKDRQRAADAVLLNHLPWLTTYARNTARVEWDAEMVEEYLHELILVAIQRIPHYKQRADKAPFKGYLSRYLRPVKYKLHGRNLPIAVGIETARLIVMTQSLVASGITDPAEIAERLSKTHGKPIGVARVRTILGRATVVSGDAELSDGENATSHWDLLSDPALSSIEDDVIAEMEGGLADVVAERIESLGELRPLDAAIVHERLLGHGTTADGSCGPTPSGVIAKRFGITQQAVQRAEAEVAALLRDLLGDLAA